jgi:hypothetical protein
MLTDTLDLDVLRHGEGDMPFTPQAAVYAKTYTTDERGLIMLTPGCENLHEIEVEIERLQNELEVIRSKARREFSKI